MYYSAKYPNEFIAVRTSITVPEKPPKVGTVFLWPGLDPGPSPRFLPIDNGVLQPVLTWGTSCAPGLQPPAYTSWWISAQYVNTFGHEPGYTDCHGGPNMRVSPGDVLDLSLAASWNDMDANNPRRTNERLSTLRIRPPRSATKPALLWDRTLRRNADFASPFSKHDDRRRASRSGRLSRQKRYERRSAQSRFALHIPRRERNLSR